MAFSEQELQLIQYGVQNGKSRQEVEQALARLRSGVKPSSFQAPEPTQGAFVRAVKDVPQDFMQMGENLLKTGTETGQKIVNAATSDRTLGQRITDVGAESFRGLSRLVAEPYIFAAKAVATPELEQQFAKTAESAIKFVADTELAQDIRKKYESLSPEEQQQVNNALGFAEFPATVGTAGLFGKLTKAILPKAKIGVPEAPLEAPRPPLEMPKPEVANIDLGAIQNERVRGVLQIAKELADRAKRATVRGAETVEEAAQRAKTLETATPAVRGAIEVGLEPRIVEGLSAVDRQTLAKMREMVDVAETSGTKMGVQPRPEIKAGDVIAEQYKVIDDARKAVGEQINEAVKKLDAGRKKIDVSDAQQQMRDVLQWNGVTVGEKGKLYFRTKFTPTQEALIQQLYDRVTKLGTKMSARDIYDLNQQLAKLQREAKFSEVGDILVDTPLGEKQSLFSVFRDLTYKTLDDISPEIRSLNAKYKPLRTLVDDIDDSLLKSGKFQTTKGVDPAEYAQTNLRRLFSDAQSAADYRAIADTLDKTARALGYKGADARALMAFANELRRLYPEAVPPTGFQGGIRTTLRGVAEELLQTGKPNITDKQRALKALIDELLGKNSPAVGKTVRDVKVPDKKLVAPKAVPKTPEIIKVEKEIAKNVEAQKVAIKAGNFALVEKLKQAYDVLVAKLKSLVQKVKNTPNKEGGFIGGTRPKSASKETTQLKSVESSSPDTISSSLEAQARNFKTPEEFVKAQGTPVYHGTQSSFESFDLNKSGTRNPADQGFAGRGIYFTNSKEVANTFANGRDIFPSKEAPKGAGRVVEAYITIPESKILSVNSYRELYEKLGFTPSQKRPANVGLIQYINEHAPKIREKAQQMGYGAIRVDGGGKDSAGIMAHEIVVFDPKNIKTPSQLINIWKKAQGSTDLLTEAKKYKSAEEFVKKNLFFRGEGGTNPAAGKAQLAKGKHFALGDEKYAKTFGETKSYVAKPGAKIFDAGGMDYPEIQKALGLPVGGKFAYISPEKFTEALKKNGYDILRYDGTLRSDGRPFVHVVEITPNSFVEQTPSQLTDIWKKAHGKL